MSRGEFRAVALVGAGCVLGGSALGAWAEEGLSESEKILLEWNYYGAVFSHELALGFYVVMMGLYWLGLVGFLLFQPIGRSLFLAAHCLAVLCDPFLGWRVYSPFWNGVAGIGGALLMTLLVLSYFAPHGRLFGDVEAEEG